jgi:cysteine desulfurase
MIYLDSASSYPILPEVMESLTKSFRTHYANSSSSHSLGLQEAEVVKN